MHKVSIMTSLLFNSKEGIDAGSKWTIFGVVHTFQFLASEELHEFEVGCIPYSLRPQFPV